MLETINVMIDILTETKENIEKFERKGNKSAGTKARVALQDVKRLAQEVRIKIQEAKTK